jgi:hypothetical protein
LARFKALARENPDDARAHLHVAELEKQLGRPIEAAASYRIVSALHARDKRTRAAAAALILARRLLNEALPEAAEPFAAVSVELAHVQVEQGFRADALSGVDEALRRLVSQGPRSAALDIATGIADLAAHDAHWMRLRADALRLGGLGAEAAGVYCELVAELELIDGNRDSILPTVVSGLLASAPSIADLNWAARSLIRRGTTAAIGAARSIAEKALALQPADNEARELALAARDLTEHGMLLAFDPAE